MRLPLAMRQRRDLATASLAFFLVMDQEGWRYNAHQRVALQHFQRPSRTERTGLAG